MFFTAPLSGRRGALLTCHEFGAFTLSLRGIRT
jgi:hypothetical protein